MLKSFLFSSSSFSEPLWVRPAFCPFPRQKDDMNVKFLTVGFLVLMPCGLIGGY